MSYESSLLGTLWIDPFPTSADMPALREALAAISTPKGGRLVLTPLGHGLTFEHTFDWESALVILQRAHATVFAPRGMTIGGGLNAIGEDEAHLATVTVDADGVHVELHETEEDDADDPAEAADDEASGDEGSEPGGGGEPDKESEWSVFRGEVMNEGLAAYGDALERLCVPSLRLQPRKRSTLATRLGGLPDVPAGFVWPTSAEGEPLTFVGQVDLAEVRRVGMPGSEVLPERGVLSFFHGYAPGPDDEHCGSAGQVLYFDGAAPLSPARAPTHARFTALPSIPVGLELQTEELPPIESPFYALLLDGAGALKGDPYEAAYDVFRGIADTYSALGVRDEDERPVHRLLGYADPLQADVYIGAEGNAAVVPTEAWTTIEHYRAAAKWRLLLQVDSDPVRDMMFGDGGVLAFMIREEDLAARRFDRVWVEWQSH